MTTRSEADQAITPSSLLGPSTIPRSRASRAAVLGVATALAATLVTWLIVSSPLVEVLQRVLRPLSPLASFAVGLPTFAVVLVLPAACWAILVARLAGVDRGPVVRTTVAVGIPLALVVGVAVDLSQLFIDTVHSWHHLAVHGLFTVAFAAGLALFLGVVTTRVTGRIATAHGAGLVPDGHRPGLGSRVAVATVLGVVAGAGLAIPLDWVVTPGMGRLMLQPLYLVMVTGHLAGGAMFGWSLPGRQSATSATPQA